MTYEDAQDLYIDRMDDPQYGNTWCRKAGNAQERFLKNGKDLHDAFALAVDLLK